MRSSTISPPSKTQFSGALVEAMQACLAAEDPHAQAVPYPVSAATDAKAWDRAGIACFGFAPLRLPPELDFWGMFHGVDERVPTDSLEFWCPGFRPLPGSGVRSSYAVGQMTVRRVEYDGGANPARPAPLA